MTDTYQAIFDATRGKISSGNAQTAIENAAREAMGNVDHQIAWAVQAIALEHTRPSVVFRPRIALDGNAWICCLGDNIQEGVVGCGDTPAEAMAAFDKAWHEKQPAQPVGAKP